MSQATKRQAMMGRACVWGVRVAAALALTGAAVAWAQGEETGAGEVETVLAETEIAHPEEHDTTQPAATMPGGEHATQP